MDQQANQPVSSEISSKQRRELEKQEQRRQESLKKQKRSAKNSLVFLLIIGAVVGFFWGVVKLKKLAETNQPGLKIEEMASDRHIPIGESHEPYNSSPPTSGPHYANPANWGIYDRELEYEALVHNLEHGGIVIGYRDLDEESVKKLTALFEKLQKINGRAIMAPDSKLTDAKITLTAWGWLDKLQSYEEKRIADFFQAHVDRGPEKVPMTF